MPLGAQYPHAVAVVLEVSEPVVLVANIVDAVIYVTDRPRRWPGRFGAHDLWHVFGTGGSVFHFVLIRGYLAQNYGHKKRG